MSELVFLLSADTDIQTAYEFYEAYQAGRGDVFMRHLDFAFGRVSARSQKLHRSSTRRTGDCSSTDFPYGIFYTIEGRRILISGVMDLRQDPNIIRQRLRGRSGS